MTYMFYLIHLSLLMQQKNTQMINHFLRHILWVLQQVEIVGVIITHIKKLKII